MRLITGTLLFLCIALLGCKKTTPGESGTVEGPRASEARQTQSRNASPSEERPSASEKDGDRDENLPPEDGEAPQGLEAPQGMVYVPGGTTRIGITEATWNQVVRTQKSGPRPPWGHSARPSFVTQVEPFFLDKHPVTVTQFRRFVEETGYETQAESFGNAGVLQQGRWRLVDGATWHHPRGPNADAAPDDHPVTQVSYHDAVRYCEWRGRRLPTEVEWEHAARDGKNDRAFCAGGTCPSPSGPKGGDTAVANIWQGRFPVQNTVADGYRYTSPVGAFGETELGLTDMSGNVWEWTSSWYRPYTERSESYQPTKQSEKVQRGGSFQCNECGGFHLFARSHATRETSLFHVGFRCARDLEK